MDSRESKLSKGGTETGTPETSVLSVSLFRSVSVEEYKLELSSNVQSIIPTIIDKDVFKTITKCMEETQKTISQTSSRVGGESLAGAIEEGRQLIRTSIYTKLKESNISISENLLLKLYANAIKVQKCGNCLEFSLFCHYLLQIKKIKSEVFRINNGDHVFLVINRDTRCPANNYNLWNSEAFIIDPFFMKIYTPSEIPLLLKSYICRKETGLGEYVAFDPHTQTLENSVLTEFVADWRLLFESVAPGKISSSIASCP